MIDRSLELREGLEDALVTLSTEARFPSLALEGQLLRPLIAFAAGGFSATNPAPRGFWYGALAVQMVHEASLLHDDILDEAGRRRGEPALAARSGIGVALLEGDHLLTAAYRAAALTGSLEFVEAFARAVERTVAGEKAQCAARGRRLSEAEYLEIIGGKSGELFGAAFALPAFLDSSPAPSVDEWVAFGRQVGCLYQRVDDFLDLCRSAEVGKPALQDLGQKKWTWPLAIAGYETFPEGSPLEIAEFLVRRDHLGGSIMRRGIEVLRTEAERLIRHRVHTFPRAAGLDETLRSWLSRAEGALADEEAEFGHSILPSTAGTGESRATAPEAGVATVDAEILEAVRLEATALGEDGEWTSYFAHHSKSFRFSARLFPRDEGRLVSGVYAFCRFTDDLVDRNPDDPPALRRARLKAWSHWSREAYGGRTTGIPLLDEVMGETAGRSVPFRYVEELLRGVAMDIEPTEFEDLEALRVYSYRVASVVGLWLTELFGTHTPWVLRRAELMGHAMQLTNILRDVGEDWRTGRLYLPLDRLEAHGVTPDQIGRAVEKGGLPAGWPGLIEELIREAEKDYEQAFEAIPALPTFFQRPVAVAGRVYGGIHREIRLNDYDNLHRRAMTSLGRKVMVGGGALWDLRRTRKASPGIGSEAGALASPSKRA
ncbi:MAG: hypothetical protein EA351_09720 [Gemmatimonadales bacterium]|nr:MAG: hypothetical protein EA351_09720 [Gemmatimonadales bacterium]